MYFSKDADSVPTFESPWIHRGWTPAPLHLADPPPVFGVPSHIPWPHRPAGLNAFNSLECSNIGVFLFSFIKFMWAASS